MLIGHHRLFLLIPVAGEGLVLFNEEISSTAEFPSQNVNIPCQGLFKGSYTVKHKARDQEHCE